MQNRTVKYFWQHFLFIFRTFWHIGYRIAFLQYRRKFWWIAIIFAICGEFSSANICESPIFLPCTVIYLLFQFSWLLVPCLTINFGDFLCDLFVELTNFSQILLASTVIIFVFLPVLFLPNLVIIFIGPESDHCLPLSLTNSLTHSLTAV